MGYIKNYMFDLADRLGIDVNEVKQHHMENDQEGIKLAEQARLEAEGNKLVDKEINEK